jgi:hypothetical protein
MAPEDKPKANNGHGCWQQVPVEETACCQNFEPEVLQNGHIARVAVIVIVTAGFYF